MTLITKRCSDWFYFNVFTTEEEALAWLLSDK